MRLRRDRSRSPRRVDARPHIACGAILDWAFGHKSAPRVKLEMQRCVRDGALQNTYVHPLVARISRIGGMRSYSTTAHRDLMKIGKVLCDTNLHTETGGRHLKTVVQPHVLLSTLADKYPARLRQSLGADHELCFRFWDHLYTSDHGKYLWEEHQLLQSRTPEDLRFHVPGTIFEDAGPFSKKHSRNALFVQVFLARAEK